MEWTVVSIGINGSAWSPRRSSYLGKVTRVADQMGEKGGEAMLFRSHSSRDFNKDLSHALEMTSMAMTMNGWRGTKFSIR
jgi:hypothetical protein